MQSYGLATSFEYLAMRSAIPPVTLPTGLTSPPPAPPTAIANEGLLDRTGGLPIVVFTNGLATDEGSLQRFS